MPSDEERLAILIEGKVKDFDRAVARVEKSVAKMQKGIDGEMRQVQRSSKRAADSMARDFEVANRKVLGQFAQVRGAVSGALGGLGVGAGVGLIGGAGLSSMVREVNDAAAAITELRAEARRAGLTFQQFQELKFAFGREKVSIDALTDGFKELQLRADEFIVTGKGSAQEAFQRLGYSAESLKQKMADVPELFLEIMERARGLDRAAQIRVFDELLGGTGGEQFVQLMEAGTDSIREGIARARELGIVLSDDVADRAAEVDRWFQEITATISSEMGPALVSAGETMKNLISIAGQVSEAIQGWRTAADSFLKGLGPVGEGLSWLNNFGPHRAAIGGARDLIDYFGNTDALERQEDRVKRLEEQLAEANRLAAMPEGEVGATAIERARRNASLLRLELEEANLEFLRLKRGGGSTVPTDLGTIRPAAQSAPPIVVPPAADNLLADAKQFLNKYENPDSAEVRAMLSSGGVDVANLATTAWCAAFVNAVLQRNGYKGSGSLAARSLLNVGVPVDNPQPGDIAVFSRGSNPAQGHTGFFSGYDQNGNIKVVGGNQGSKGGGGVTESTYSRDRLLGFRSVRGEAANSYIQNADNERLALIKDQEAARLRQAEAIAAVNEQLKTETDLETIRQEMLASGKYKPEDITRALAQEAEIRQTLNALRQAGVEIGPAEEEFWRNEIERKNALIEKNDELVRSQERLADRSADMKAAFIGVGQPIVDTFLSIADGSAKAEDAVKGLIRQLANMVIQGALFGGGPLGGLFGGGIAGALFPGRASGGPVKAGMAYNVGEHGQELFVPNVNGRIINAAQMGRAMPAGGGGGGQISLSLVSRFDADGGFESAVERSSRPVARMESQRAAGQVAKAVPAIVDQRSEERQTRRIRPQGGA